jgi:hypothetical protein
MWLLDANVDIHLVSFLGNYGIPCDAATRRGWGGLTNGSLVAAAIGAGFTCLLTHDRLFAESASRVLADSPTFSVVIIHLLQKPWRAYIEQFRTAWERQPIVPQPGAVILWPE